MEKTKPMNRDEKAREDLKNKNTNKIMEKLKDAECAWPGCNKKQFMIMNLPLMMQTPQGPVPVGPDGNPGKPGDKPSTAIPAPFCMYHFGIPAAGYCMAFKDPKDSNKFQIIVPMDMVGIAEAVISGMIFSGQMEELMKAKDVVNKKAQGEKDETNGKDAQNKGDEHADTDGNKQCPEVQHGQSEEEKKD